MNYSLNKFQGVLGNARARHLLSRSLFCFNRKLISKYALLSIDEAIALLMRQEDLLTPPLSVRNSDIEVKPGETWVNVNYNPSYRSQRLFSLRGWWVDAILRQNDTIREKMTFFWHNHFATETTVVKNTNFLFNHYTLIRKNALGNFKTFLEQITLDPAMLIYLDGRTNKVGAANENYGRELLELFTIGKGQLIGPGNYSNYTEDDIREAA